MAALQVEYPPAAEPVAVTDLKTFLRVTIDDDDDLIEDLGIAARELVEGWTGRSLVNKGYRQSLDSFPYFTDTTMSQLAYPPSYYALPRYSTTLWNYSQMMKLFRSPLRFITSISYQDSQSGTTKQLYAALPNWQALTEYDLGDVIEDQNGNQQIVVIANENEDAGASVSGPGPSPPAFSAVVNGTTVDGDLTWKCLGVAPTPSFLFDRDSEPPRIFPMAGGFWPSVLYVPNAVQIHFVAGYGPDGKNVPACARVAIRQLVAHWYQNREAADPSTIKEMPLHLENLLWNIRVLDFAPTRG